MNITEAIVTVFGMIAGLFLVFSIQKCSLEETKMFNELQKIRIEKGILK